MTERLKSLLDGLTSDFRAVLGENLMGFYVHGSIAFGCFRWETSDVDFLAVARRGLTLDEKTALIRAILNRTPDAPEKGIEMSVITEKACRRFIHPCPFELHFSNSHLEAYCKDLEGYAANMHGVDPDLAAHFAVTRAVGIALIGPEPKAMFAPIPREDVLDSILLDVQDADVPKNPVYFILNLCRVLAYKEENLLLSKAGGGKWMRPKLPEDFRATLECVQAAYTKGGALPEMEKMLALAKWIDRRIFGRIQA